MQGFVIGGAGQQADDTKEMSGAKKRAAFQAGGRLNTVDNMEQARQTMIRQSEEAQKNSRKTLGAKAQAEDEAFEGIDSDIREALTQMIASSSGAEQYEANQGPDVFLRAGAVPGQRKGSHAYVWLIMVLLVLEVLFIGFDTDVLPNEEGGPNTLSTYDFILAALHGRNGGLRGFILTMYSNVVTERGPWYLVDLFFFFFYYWEVRRRAQLLWDKEYYPMSLDIGGNAAMSTRDLIDCEVTMYGRVRIPATGVVYQFEQKYEKAQRFLKAK